MNAGPNSAGFGLCLSLSLLECRRPTAAWVGQLCKLMHDSLKHAPPEDAKSSSMEPVPVAVRHLPDTLWLIDRLLSESKAISMPIRFSIWNWVLTSNWLHASTNLGCLAVLNHQIGGACVSTCSAAPSAGRQGVSTLGRNVNFEHALNVVNKRVQQLRPLLCYALRQQQLRNFVYYLPDC